MPLTGEELERYHRQIILEPIGSKGQERLKSSSVLIIGCGGLGSPIAFYLTGAGIGRIGILDSDQVNVSNLQRQILHQTKDLGKAKTQSARETLEDLNPRVSITTYGERLTSENIHSILDQYQLVIDAVDNFPTRYLVNKACVEQNKPLIEAGIHGFDSQIITIIPHKGPCYNCLFPETLSSEEEMKEIGVVGAICGITGSLQALEAIKLLLEIGEPLQGRLLLFSGLQLSFQELQLKKDPACRVCGKKGGT